MKRSKESHELPQGLTRRPYQPGSSTVLFIALNRAPPNSTGPRHCSAEGAHCLLYLSLTPRSLRRAVIYRDIKPGPNYRRVIAQFGSDAASIRRRHLWREIRRIAKEERGEKTHIYTRLRLEPRGGRRQKNLPLRYWRTFECILISSNAIIEEQ